MRGVRLWRANPGVLRWGTQAEPGRYPDALGEGELLTPRSVMTNLHPGILRKLSLIRGGAARGPLMGECFSDKVFLSEWSDHQELSDPLNNY